MTKFDQYFPVQACHVFYLHYTSLCSDCCKLNTLHTKCFCSVIFLVFWLLFDGGSEENEASQVDDGTLNDKEKEALQTLAMAEDCTGPPEDAEKTLAEDEERSEEDLNSDDDQRIGDMRKALQQSTPGSLRHRQITSMLQTRLRERKEQRARDELQYQRRRDRLVARGVSPRRTQTSCHKTLLILCQPYSRTNWTSCARKPSRRKWKRGN